MAVDVPARSPARVDDERALPAARPASASRRRLSAGSPDRGRLRRAREADAAEGEDEKRRRARFSISRVPPASSFAMKPRTWSRYFEFGWSFANFWYSASASSGLFSARGIWARKSSARSFSSASFVVGDRPGRCCARAPAVLAELQLGGGQALERAPSRIAGDASGAVDAPLEPRARARRSRSARRARCRTRTPPSPRASARPARRPPWRTCGSASRSCGRACRSRGVFLKPCIRNDEASRRRRDRDRGSLAGSGTLAASTFPSSESSSIWTGTMPMSSASKSKAGYSRPCIRRQSSQSCRLNS